MENLRSSRRSIVTELFFLLQWTTLSQAWVNIATQIDLSWPPISVWRDINIEGDSSVTYWPNMTASNDTLAMELFDCARFALQPNVARTDFPITGGMVQLNFSALSALHISDNATNVWEVQFKIGQFSGLDNRDSIGGVTWAPQSELDNMTWTAEEFAANLGSWCSPGLDIPATINYSREIWTWDDSLPNKEKLVGMNATLWISIIKWKERQGPNIGQMTQCSYIRFTDTTNPLVPCRSPAVLDPFPEPLPTSSIVTSSSIANPNPTSTSSAIKAEGGGLSISQLSIALAVICPIVFILIVGCCGWKISRKYRERCRARKTEHSSGVDNKFEHGDSKTKCGVDEIGERAEKGERELEENAPDVISSVGIDDSITVPPPTYAEALEEFKGEKAKDKLALKVSV